MMMMTTMVISSWKIMRVYNDDTNDANGNDFMCISMMMTTTVVMTVIKEESKEHGRTLVAIAAYSQVFKTTFFDQKI